jgi:hypothetical protein
MADMIMDPQEIKPKDILRYVETRAERAIEMLREFIDRDGSDYGGLEGLMQAAQAVRPQEWLGSTAAGTMFGGVSAANMANQFPSVPPQTEPVFRGITNG